MAKRTHVFDPRQSMNRPDFEIFHYQDAKMQEVELHHHDFYEVYYFLGGRVEYLVEGRSYTLLSDDILLINPMELHRPNVAPDEAYERIVLWISREYLNAIAPEADLAHRCFATGRNLYHCAHTQIPVLIRRLAGKASDDAPGSELAARGLLLELMGELLRLTSGGERDTAGREETPLVSEILRYIGAHYAEPLSFSSLPPQRGNESVPLCRAQAAAARAADARRGDESRRGFSQLRLSRLCQLLPRFSRRLRHQPERGRIALTARIP